MGGLLGREFPVPVPVPVLGCRAVGTGILEGGLEEGGGGIALELLLLAIVGFPGVPVVATGMGILDGGNLPVDIVVDFGFPRGSFVVDRNLV